MSPGFRIIHGAGRAAVGGAVGGFLGTKQALARDDREERLLGLQERGVAADEERNRLREEQFNRQDRMRRAAAEANLLLNLPNEVAHLAPGIAAAGRTFGGDSVDGVRLLEDLDQEEWQRLTELDPEDQSRYLVRRAEVRRERQREDMRGRALQMLDAAEMDATSPTGTGLPPEVIGQLRQGLLEAKGQDVDAAVGAIDSAMSVELKRREDEREKLVAIEDLEARAQRMRETASQLDGSIDAEEALDAERKRLLALADDVRLGRITYKEARAAVRGMGRPGEAPVDMAKVPGREDGQKAPKGYWNPPAEDPERQALDRAAEGLVAARDPNALIGANGQRTTFKAAAEEKTRAGQIEAVPPPAALAAEAKAGGGQWPKPRKLADLAKQYPGLDAEWRTQVEAVFNANPANPDARFPELAGIFRAYGVDPRDPEVQKALREIGSAALQGKTAGDRPDKGKPFGPPPEVTDDPSTFFQRSWTVPQVDGEAGGGAAPASPAAPRRRRPSLSDTQDALRARE